MQQAFCGKCFGCHDMRVNPHIFRFRRDFSAKNENVRSETPFDMGNTLPEEGGRGVLITILSICE
jgi:hypothetical protein